MCMHMYMHMYWMYMHMHMHMYMHMYMPMHTCTCDMCMYFVRQLVRVVLVRVGRNGSVGWSVGWRPSSKPSGARQRAPPLHLVAPLDGSG